MEFEIQTGLSFKEAKERSLKERMAGQLTDKQFHEASLREFDLLPENKYSGMEQERIVRYTEALDDAERFAYKLSTSSNVEDPRKVRDSKVAVAEANNRLEKYTAEKSGREPELAPTDIPIEWPEALPDEELFSMFKGWYWWDKFDVKVGEKMVNAKKKAKEVLPNISEYNAEDRAELKKVLATGTNKAKETAIKDVLRQASREGLLN